MGFEALLSVSSSETSVLDLLKAFRSTFSLALPLFCVVFVGLSMSCDSIVSNNVSARPSPLKHPITAQAYPWSQQTESFPYDPSRGTRLRDKTAPVLG